MSRFLNFTHLAKAFAVVALVLLAAACLESTTRPPVPPPCETDGATDASCECPDPADPTVTYVSDDPDFCATVLIACDGTGFSNECGCGCIDDQPPCAAQDAEGIGACRALLGVVFDGTSCASISGCECEGADCSGLYASVEACELDNTECLPAECPDATDPRVHYTSMDVSFCAAALLWCGDGEGFSDECGCGCIYSEATGCSAQDARGDGACRQSLGWVWDGASCVGLGGCACVGADCDSVYPTEEVCLGVYASCEPPPEECPDPADPNVHYIHRDPAECAVISFFCPDGATGFSDECGCGCIGMTDPCSAQDARGEGACRADVGWIWDGASCSHHSGCECVGSDCADIFATEVACRAVYASCEAPAECPDPADPKVHYIGEDAGSCAAILFACEDDQTPFSDECGCGCIDD